MMGYFEGAGVRFQYPPLWSLEVNEDESRTVIEFASEMNCFTMVSIDSTRPDPEVEIQKVIDGLREDYPALDITEIPTKFAGFQGKGENIEFFSLDMAVEAAIRSTRTTKRTITIFTQWSEESEDEQLALGLRQILQTIEELDEVDPED